MKLQRLRSWLNLILPFLLVLAAALPRLGLGTSMADMAHAADNPAIPADGSFLIWPLLFLAAVAWGVWQMLPRAAASPWPARLGWPLALLFLACLLWMLSSAFLNDQWTMLALMLVGLLAALVAAWLAQADRGAPLAEQWFLRPFTGLWAGWMSAALFADIGMAARATGVIGTGLEATLAAILLLLAAGGLGALLLWFSRGAVWYALGLAWAFLGIAYGNLFQRGPDFASAAVALLMLALIVAVTWNRRKSAPPRVVVTAMPSTAAATSPAGPVATVVVSENESSRPPG